MMMIMVPDGPWSARPGASGTLRLALVYSGFKAYHRDPQARYKGGISAYICSKEYQGPRGIPKCTKTYPRDPRDPFEAHRDLTGKRMQYLQPCIFMGLRDLLD